MEILGLILLVVGGLGAVVTGVWLLVLAFKESVGWGLGCLFCGIVTLVFVFTHWDDTKKPFLWNVGATLLIMLATLLTGESEVTPELGGQQTIAMTAPEDAPTTGAEPAVAPTSDRYAPPPTPAPRRAPAPPPAEPLNPAPGSLVAERPAVPPSLTAPPPSKEEPAPDAKRAPISEPPPLARKPEPLILPGHEEAVAIEVLQVKEATRTGMGQLKLRVANHTRKAVKNVTVTLNYLDRDGRLLKQWKTSPYQLKPALASDSTVSVSEPAYFMPMATKSVRVRVNQVTFDDETMWP